MDVQGSTRFIHFLIVRMVGREGTNLLEALEEKIPLSLAQLADKLKDGRIDQQPAFHSAAGSSLGSGI